MTTHPGVEFMRALVADAGLQDGDVVQVRAAMAAASADTPPKEGTGVIVGELGGRPAEWVVPNDLSSDDTAAPVVLYLHGGGYCMGNMDTHRPVCGRIALAAGARVVMLDYRLAPEDPFPAAIDDAIAAYLELIEEGADPGRLVVAGDSAGGGLTLALLLRLRDEGGPMPAAAVLLSPWTDLTQSAPCYEFLDGFDPLLDRARLQELADTYLGDADPLQPAASPVFADDLVGLPPLSIDVGDQEVLLEDSTRIADLAENSEVDVKLTVWPGLTHVFQIYPAELFPEGDTSIAAMGSFIREHTA